MCSPPRATIGLEFVEYTWRENEYHSLQVCTVATEIAFPIVAEFHIKNGTASGTVRTRAYVKCRGPRRKGVNSFITLSWQQSLLALVRGIAI